MGEAYAMLDFFDTPENYRSERVDDAPHARPRQVEGLLDTGMYDFAFAGSIPA